MLRRILKSRKSHSFVLFSISLAVFWAFVFQTGTATRGAPKPRTWESIHLLKDGFCSFSYRVQGDKDDYYQVTINITGFSVGSVRFSV